MDDTHEVSSDHAFFCFHADDTNKSGEHKWLNWLEVVGCLTIGFQWRSVALRLLRVKYDHPFFLVYLEKEAPISGTKYDSILT